MSGLRRPGRKHRSAGKGGGAPYSGSAAQARGGRVMDAAVLRTRLREVLRTTPGSPPVRTEVATEPAPGDARTSTQDRASTVIARDPSAGVDTIPGGVWHEK